MSDSKAKPSPAGKAADRAGRGGAPAKGARSRRSSLGDIGNALSAAYKDTLKEEVPPDLLALLGKLD